MITQLDVQVKGRTESLTFEGKFPSKSDVLKFLNELILLKDDVYDSYQIVWETYYKIIKSIKPKDWPTIKFKEKEIFVSSKGNIEFAPTCIWIFQSLNSGFPIIWRILFPHKI